MAKDVSVIFRVDEEIVAKLDRIVDEVALGNRSDHLRKALIEYVQRHEKIEQAVTA